jgi:hypothetical protein
MVAEVRSGGRQTGRESLSFYVTRTSAQFLLAVVADHSSTKQDSAHRVIEVLWLCTVYPQYCGFALYTPILESLLATKE